MKKETFRELLDILDKSPPMTHAQRTGLAKIIDSHNKEEIYQLRRRICEYIGSGLVDKLEMSRDQDWLNLLRGGKLKSCPEAEKRTLAAYKLSARAFAEAEVEAEREWEED